MIYLNISRFLSLKIFCSKVLDITKNAYHHTIDPRYWRLNGVIDELFVVEKLIDFKQTVLDIGKDLINLVKKCL